MPGAGRVADRLERVYRLLLAAYGPQRWWPARGDFEMAAGAILTQNTSWSGASKAVRALGAAGLLEATPLLRAADERVRRLIRPAGCFRVKTRRLKAFAAFVVSQTGGGMRPLRRIPSERLRRLLLGVEGIGEETADCILLYAARKPAFVADAYARRLFGRLGALPTGSYPRLRKETMGALAGWRVRDYNEFHALIVEHSKRRCRTKPVCRSCPLARQCKYFKSQDLPLRNLAVT